jgi:hypothetical protein
MSLPTWSHLRAAALAGTLHHPSPRLSPHNLLLAAGTLERRERATWQAVPGTGTTPLPPPPETLPAVGPLGAHLLETMLAGTSPGHPPSYYRDLALSGLRVPHRLLAAVLEQASEAHLYSNDYLLEVLGERGRWLARLQPAWRPLITVREERTWTHGLPEQRRNFLLACRQQDPARGRALLAASLPHDPPWLQAHFLSALFWQLTAEDEPLLRTCLFSPSRDVRQAATGLLQRLPGHGLVEQLWEWATQFLTVVTSPDTGPVLLVTLPERWEPEWQQAGVEREYYNRGGEQAGWLSQMLALIPPARWSAHWQLPPLQLLKMASATSVSADLLAGWSTATYSQQQTDWGLAFLEDYLTRPPACSCVQAEQAEALLLPLIPPTARLSDTPAPWQEALRGLHGSWTKPVLLRVLQLLEDTLHHPSERWHFHAERTIRQLVLDLVEYAPEAHYHELEHRLQALSDAGTGPIERIGSALDQLRFQRQLRLSLTEPPTPEG